MPGGEDSTARDLIGGRTPFEFPQGKQGPAQRGRRRVRWAGRRGCLPLESANEMKSLSILVYDEKTAPLQTAGLAEFLGETLGLPVEAREEFIGWHLAGLSEGERRARFEELAREFSYLRVRKVEAPDSFSAPLPMEVEMEYRRLVNRNRGPSGIVYDGFHFQKRMGELLSPKEANLRYLHIILTNRLLASWERDDRRHHLRTIILGQPAVISTSGLVEAPAKPREYYFLRQRLPGDEVSRAALRRQFAGRFLEDSDERMNDLVKGYLLQAFFYFLTGEAFCPNPDCRLFNAHWQEEMLHAQTRPGAGLCEVHEEVLKRLAGI